MTSRHLAGRWRQGGARVIACVVLGAALVVTLPMPGAGHAGEVVTHSDVGLLWLPDSEASSAPVPVVIALHDLLGIDQRGWRYGEQLTAAGIAVLHVELQEVSADGFVSMPVRDEPAAKLARLAIAIDSVAEDPRFAHAAIGILAFGAAGQVAMRAAADRTTAGRIAAMALLYPGCAAIPAPTQETALQSPVLLLHGDADPANSPADCAGLAGRIARSAPVRRRQYAGAGYAWDLPAIGLDAVRKLPWPDRPGMWLPASHWPEAAEFSAAQVASFFARALSAQP